MYQEDLIVLRNGRKAPERSGEYWSKEDLETLQNLFWEGVNLSEIAIRLGRNEMATYTGRWRSVACCPARAAGSWIQAKVQPAPRWRRFCRTF